MTKAIALFVSVINISLCTILTKKTDLGVSLEVKERIDKSNSNHIFLRPLSIGSSNLDGEIREKPLSESRILGQTTLEKEELGSGSVATLQPTKKIFQNVQKNQSEKNPERRLPKGNKKPGELNKQAKIFKSVLDNKDVVFRLGIFDNKRQLDPSCFTSWENKEEGSIEAMINAYYVVLEKYDEPLTWELIGEIREKLDDARLGTVFQNPMIQINDISSTDVSFGVPSVEKNIDFPYFQAHRDEFNKRFESEICGKNTNQWVVRYCHAIKDKSIKQNLSIHEQFKTNMNRYIYDFENPSVIRSRDWAKNYVPTKEDVDREIKVMLNDFLFTNYDELFARRLGKSLQEFLIETVAGQENTLKFDDIVQTHKLEIFQKYISSFAKVSYENFKELDFNKFQELIKQQIEAMFVKMKTDKINGFKRVKASSYFEEVSKLFSDLEVVFGLKQKVMVFLKSPKINLPELTTFAQEIIDNAEYYPYMLIIKDKQENKDAVDSRVYSYLPEDKKKAIVDALLENYNSKENPQLEDLANLISDLERIHPFNDFNARTFGALVLNKELLRMNQSPSIMFQVEQIDYKRTAVVVQEIQKGQKFYEALTKPRFAYAGYPENQAVFFAINIINSLLVISEKGKCTKEVIDNSGVSSWISGYMPQIAKIDKSTSFLPELISLFYKEDYFLRTFINLSKKSQTENLMDNSYVKLLRTKLIQNVKNSHKIKSDADAIQQLEINLRA